MMASSSNGNRRPLTDITPGQYRRQVIYRACETLKDRLRNEREENQQRLFEPV